MSDDTKESYVDEAKRRIAHLSYKLEQAQGRVRKLEYDNAQLQVWVDETCLTKLRELSDELCARYNQKKHRARDFKSEVDATRPVYTNGA